MEKADTWNDWRAEHLDRNHHILICCVVLLYDPSKSLIHTRLSMNTHIPGMTVIFLAKKVTKGLEEFLAFSFPPLKAGARDEGQEDART